MNKQRRQRRAKWLRWQNVTIVINVKLMCFDIMRTIRKNTENKNFERKKLNKHDMKKLKTLQR